MEIYIENLDYIDKIIFAVLIIINVLLWKKEHSCLIHTITIILIGFVLPFWSAGREIDRNVSVNGPAMDNFELLYVYLVFPVYWFVMVLQLFLFFVKSNFVNNVVSKGEA